jgi:hypothetical protein
MDKRKILLFVLAVVILLGVAGYLVWDYSKNKSGKCVVLPEIFCGSAKETYVSSQFIGISANLQPGSKIYAPFDGVLKYSGKTTMNGEETGIWIVENSPTDVLDSETIDAVFFANLTRKLDQGKDVAIKKGESLGRTTSPLAASDSYNFLADFKRYNPNFGYALTDAALLHQFFPAE